MKKIIWLLLFVCMSIFCTVPALASTTDEGEAYVNEADAAIFTAVDDALNDFSSAIESAESDEQLIQKIEVLVGGLEKMSEHSFNEEAGEDYLQQAELVKQSASALRVELLALQQAYRDGASEDETNNLTEKISSALNNYTAAIKGLNEGVGDESDNLGNFYVILVITMSVLTFASFVWAFMWPETVAERLKLRHQIAYFSLIPLAGAIVTYFGYRFVPSGGEYTISWGAIIFGLIYYLKIIFDYRKLAKTAN